MIFMRRHETEENQENADLGKLLDGDEELEDGGDEARRVADDERDHHDDGGARKLGVTLLHLALVDPGHSAHALARAHAHDLAAPAAGGGDLGGLGGELAEALHRLEDPHVEEDEDADGEEQVHDQVHPHRVDLEESKKRNEMEVQLKDWYILLYVLGQRPPLVKQKNVFIFIVYEESIWPLHGVIIAFSPMEKWMDFRDLMFYLFKILSFFG